MSVPHTLSAYFAAGTIATGPTVVRIGVGSYLDDRLVLRVYARGGAADDARMVLDYVKSQACGERNFLRGKVLLASFEEQTEVRYYRASGAGPYKSDPAAGRVA